MWTYKEKLQAFDDVSVSSIEDFWPKLFNNVHIEAFIHGNYEVKVY